MAGRAARLDRALVSAATAAGVAVVVLVALVVPQVVVPQLRGEVARSLPVVADSGRYQGTVMVVESPEQDIWGMDGLDRLAGPRLCPPFWPVFGAATLPATDEPARTSQPGQSGQPDQPGQSERPSCVGPAPEVIGWDWDEVPAEAVESVDGITWGIFEVTGAWDGDRFTLTGPARPDEVTETPWSRFPGDLDTTACPEPSGGWRPVDPETATADALNEVMLWAETIPAYAGSWLDQSYVDEFDPGDSSDVDDELWNDPTRLVLNLRFTGDLAHWEEQVRQIWGGALCVSGAEYSVASLSAIQTELHAELPEGYIPTSGQDVVANTVVVEVLVADTEWQAELDQRYGTGAVTLSGWLQPTR